MLSDQILYIIMTLLTSAVTTLWLVSLSYKVISYKMSHVIKHTFEMKYNDQLKIMELSQTRIQSLLLHTLEKKGDKKTKLETTWETSRYITLSRAWSYLCFFTPLHWAFWLPWLPSPDIPLAVAVPWGWYGNGGCCWTEGALSPLPLPPLQSSVWPQTGSRSERENACSQNLQEWDASGQRDRGGHVTFELSPKHGKLSWNLVQKLYS